MSRGLDVGFLGGIDPQPSGGGPVLIKRVWLMTPGAQAVTAPTGTGRARAKCIGAGGRSVLNGDAYQFGGGGGGAYAAGDMAVSGGSTLNVVVGSTPSVDYADGGDTRVSSGAKTVLAKGGRGANYIAGGLGGDADQCVGDVRRSGGRGGSGGPSGGGAASAGLAGASGGAGGTPGGTANSGGGSGGGGGSAGDLGDADSLNLGSRGGYWLTNTAIPPPGPGAGGVNAYQTTSAYTGPGTGLAVIEFWSA